MENKNDKNEELKEEDLDEEISSEDSAEADNTESTKQSIFSKLKSNDKTDNEELDKILKEKEELIHNYQRLQADFSNYKKRVEKEKLSLVSFGVETLALEILPVIDNFERALDIEKDKKDSFYEGIEMIYNGLIDVLNKNEIKEIDALEKPFNPEYHHAVGMEDTDEYDKDIVIRILQKGYTMKGKVIRPTMVIVSQ